MKNILLTSISALTLSSGISSFISTNNNISSTNNNISDSNQTVFSSSYGALGNLSTWITNQSTSDKQYYSYDLLYLPKKLSNGIDPKTLFTVDTSGALQYKSGAQAQIPDQDKSTVANVKTEIESNKRVSKIKDTYNPYSKSVDSTTYFSGANSNWQYLQFGGIETPVDISSQTNADQVENCHELRESLGLYYIAKAARAKNIDQSVAISLAKYFISKSALVSTLGNNSDLIEKIMNLLDYNDEVYNWIFNTPFFNTDKNYSLNFIFDSSNNLIEIFYNKWNTNDSVGSGNISYSDSYNGTSSDNYWNSGTKILLAFWSDYANNWDDFTRLYPTYSFGSDTSLNVSSQYDSKSLSAPTGTTSSIGTSIPQTQNNSTFYISINHDGGFFGALVYLNASIMIWHDDHNIYCFAELYEHSGNATEGCSFSANVNNVTFKNGMKKDS